MLQILLVVWGANESEKVFAGSGHPAWQSLRPTHSKINEANHYLARS